MGAGREISKDREALRARWLDAIYGDYPPEARRLYAGVSDRHRNPVGHTLAEAVGELLDGVLDAGVTAALHDPMMRVIKIRSVQDFTPSQVVAFTLALKPLLRAAGERTGSSAPLPTLEARADALLLLAVDVFAECREHLYKIRIDEVQRGVSGLLRQIRRRRGEDSTETAGEARNQTSLGTAETSSEDGDARLQVVQTS